MTEIIGRRVNDTTIVEVNDGNGTKPLPHIHKHSPTGFEWAYCGSGPADLALSILTYVTDYEIAYRHYEAFKELWVAKFPEEGFTVRISEIEDWLSQRMVIMDDPVLADADAATKHRVVQMARELVLV